MSLRRFARQLVGSLKGAAADDAKAVPSDRPSLRGNPFRLEAAAQSDVGCVRADNQDSVYLENPPPGHHDHDDGLLAIVADGMGGHSGGEVASRLAVTRFAAALRHAGRSVGPGEALTSAVVAANSAVHDRAAAQPLLHGMGTTFSAVLVRDGACYAVQIGDSRLYRLRGGIVEQLSNDHTMVGELLKAGLVSAAQAASHPDRNVLTRALGTQPRVVADVWRVPGGVLAGDVFLLCSDGLYDPVPIESLAGLAAAGSAAVACAALVGAARDAGGHDNISAIVIRVLEADTGASTQAAETCFDGPVGLDDLPAAAASAFNRSEDAR